jgi:hypothetical protein
MSLDLIPSLPMTREQAEHWIAAKLAEWRALRQYDFYLFPKDEVGLADAHEVHLAWTRWADSADELYERLKPVFRPGLHVYGAADLYYAIGRTRAMLTVTTPEANVSSIEAMRAGNFIPHEVIVREFRERKKAREQATSGSQD